MKIYFFAFILVLSYTALAASVIYINADVYRNDDVDILELKITDGVVSNLFTTPEDFSIEIIGFDNRLLFEDDLPIGFESIIDTPEGGDVIELDKVNMRIRIPYFSDAQYIDINHRNALVKRISLSDYVCNRNDVCEQYENIDNCPSDCVPAGKGIDITLLASIVLIIIGIAALYLLHKRKNETHEARILRKL